MQNKDFYPVQNIYSRNVCGVNEPNAASINNKCFSGVFAQSRWRSWSALARWKAAWVARCLCPAAWAARTSTSCRGTATVRSSTRETTCGSRDSTGRTSSWRGCPRATAAPTSASPGRARCRRRTLCKSSSKVRRVCTRDRTCTSQINTGAVCSHGSLQVVSFCCLTKRGEY